MNAAAQQVNVPEVAANGLSPKERTRLSAGIFAGRLFQVNTPPVTALSKEFVEAVRGGDHGLIIYGRPRCGRTCGFRWVAHSVRNLLGVSVPVLRVPVREETVKSDGTFFQHVLEAAKHRHARDGGAPDKRSRLVKWMKARARRTPMLTFVLALDEAQFLPPEALAWLLNTDNEMDEAGYRLFVALIGTQELLQMSKDCLERRDGEMFHDRFMGTKFEFHGLRSAAELTTALKGFGATEYPPGSGLSLASNYLQYDFDLADLAPAMWSSANEIWNTHFKNGVSFELPMAHATRALVLLLDDLADGGGTAHPDATMVKNALLRARFEQHVMARVATNVARPDNQRTHWGDPARRATA